MVLEYNDPRRVDNVGPSSEGLDERVIMKAGSCYQEPTVGTRFLGSFASGMLQEKHSAHRSSKPCKRNGRPNETVIACHRTVRVSNPSKAAPVLTGTRWSATREQGNMSTLPSIYRAGSTRQGSSRGSWLYSRQASIPSTATFCVTCQLLGVSSARRRARRVLLLHIMRALKHVGRLTTKLDYVLLVCDVRGLPESCSSVAVCWERGGKIFTTRTIRVEGVGPERMARMNAKLKLTATLYRSPRKTTFDPKPSTLRVLNRSSSGSAAVLGQGELDLAGVASIDGVGRTQVRQLKLDPPGKVIQGALPITLQISISSKLADEDENTSTADSVSQARAVTSEL
eukprot:6188033-Pleurochrysis_carterae.AAC.4